MTRIAEVSTPTELDAFRALLIEYAAANPSRFSHRMTEDLAALPGRYAAPHGGLYLAQQNNTFVATGAWVRVNAEQAEIKRVYVKPAARGQGLARRITATVQAICAQRGFSQLVLSTWGDNTAALALYHSMGFAAIAPFKENPMPGLLFFGVSLDNTY
jgi:putative acetyltransferase